MRANKFGQSIPPHVATPTERAALIAHDARIAREARNRRLWRIVAACVGVLIAVILFYGVI